MTETRRLLGVLVALSAIAIVFAAGVVIVVLVQDEDQNAANPLTELVAGMHWMWNRIRSFRNVRPARR